MADACPRILVVDPDPASLEHAARQLAVLSGLDEVSAIEEAVRSLDRIFARAVRSFRLGFSAR